MNNRRLIVLVCLLLNAAGALAAHWTVNPYAFQYDMTVYAVLQVNGRTVTDYSDYEVAALDRDGACRGVAKVQTATDGTKYLYLRIRSNETQGETLTFCVYQTSTNTETWMPETINFEAESVAGTPGEPMALTLSATKMGDVNGDGSVTPSDAIMILYHYFDVEQTGFNVKAADINGDSAVTPADAIEALYLYFGSGSNARMSRENEQEPQ